jgi:hypothetical protein
LSDSENKAAIKVVKRGIENASFEDKRKITELLVEEIIVINGKVEIIHIIPIEKKGNLQLHGPEGVALWQFMMRLLVATYKSFHKCAMGVQPS